MAQFNKLQFTLQDNEGNPISGASVSIRRQGAFVTSTQAGPTYTVNDPGGLTTSDTVVPGILTTPEVTVTAVTATSITTGGSGLGTMANNDRIVQKTTLPTLYADAQGAETKTNPLTTDASGKAFCWIDASKVDVIYTATGYATAIEYDRAAVGSEMSESHIFDSGTSIAFRRWTSRTLSTAGALLARWENPKNTLKASIAYDGTIATQGNLTVAGTTALTGAVTVTGLLTANGGITSAAPFTYSGAAGSFSLTASSIETADLAANAVTTTHVGTGSADQTWTAAAAYADVTSATVTFTPFSAASEIVIFGKVPIDFIAGAFCGFARVVDGTAATIYDEGISKEAGATGGDGVTIPLLARLTGLTGSQTFKLQARVVTANANTLSSSTDRKARIVVVQYKK